MTVLSAQSIQLCVERGAITIAPFEPVSKTFKGMSYGLTGAGYDIRLGKIQHPMRDKTSVERYWIQPDGKLVLAAAMEYLGIPDSLQAQVKDKSSWARKGLAVQTTVVEPGWNGYLTLELTNHGRNAIELCAGMPIAQLVFYQLDQPTDRPYVGKYQNQSAEPTEAIEAKGE